MIHRIGESDMLQPGINLCVNESDGREWVSVYVRRDDGSVEAFRAWRPKTYDALNCAHSRWPRAGAEEFCSGPPAAATSPTPEARAFWWPDSEAWK